MQIIDNETATAPAAQDVNSRIEAALYGGDEPTDDNDDVVSDDVDNLNDDQLPEDDDTDSDEEEGSDELADDADGGDEELSLAGYLGIPEENLTTNEEGIVSFKAIIDGKEQAVPLNELTKSYQLQGHVNNKSIALENERKEFGTQKEEAIGEIEQRLMGVERLTEVLEGELLADYNAVNWEQLRRVKPDEWSALRQEFAEKANKIKQAKALTGEESERVKQERAKQFFTVRNEMIKTELGKIIASNPTWADDAVRKTDQDKMKSFLSTTYGYTDDDFATVTDSRLIALIQDAQKLHEGKQSVVKKINKKVPKFRKPGANRQTSQNLAKARDVKARKASVKKTGSIRDVANLLVDRM